MSGSKEPLPSNQDDTSESNGTAQVTEKRIRQLALGQLFGVLCTQANNQPYGSMVAFAFADDLRQFVFSTPTATRKYRFLSECHNVALVVNNQSEFPGEMMKIEAFTATGEAREVPHQAQDSPWVRLLLSRHPQLKAFLKSPTTALFVVDIVRFFHVNSFQEVHQWGPGV
jgi:uncharacterized protein YhbP (UPF0306 family)